MSEEPINSMEERIVPDESVNEEVVKLHHQLMEKGLRKMIVFLISTISIVIFVATFQGKKLFIFDITNQNLNTTELSRFFSIITYGFLLFTLLDFIYFAILWFRRKKEITLPINIEQTLPAFQCQYNLFDLLSVIPSFLLMIILINGVFLSPAVVDGRSMEPTFYDNDPVVIYHFQVNYQKEDIVIISVQNRLLIKRLIAIPGDVLKVSLSGIWVNGVLVETDVRPNGAGYLATFDGIVQEGQFFVLGDNREYTQSGSAMSNDSRYFGFIDKEQLLGKVILKIGS
jgi:signal peptidase I